MGPQFIRKPIMDGYKEMCWSPVDPFIKEEPIRDGHKEMCWSLVGPFIREEPITVATRRCVGAQWAHSWGGGHQGDVLKPNGPIWRAHKWGPNSLGMATRRCVGAH